MNQTPVRRSRFVGWAGILSNLATAGGRSGSSARRGMSGHLASLRLPARACVGRKGRASRFAPKLSHLSVVPEQALQGRGCLLVLVREQAAVGVHRLDDRLVAEASLDDSWMQPFGDQAAGVGASLSSRRQTGAVDWRIKTFDREVASAFGFLTETGFEHSVEPPNNVGRLPCSTTVRFRTPETVVEVSLTLAFAGEDAVETSVQTVDGNHRLGPSVARKGHEMRKALREQAVAARRILELN